MCSIPELDFTSPFELRVERDGQVTAVVGYFDIVFQKDCSEKASMGILLV